MSRVSLIEQLYAPKRKSALEFDYDSLWAPPIRFLLSQQDINELYKIATSLKYNDNIEKKYELIDAIMRPRGFKRGNCGTNRVVYNFLEDTSFCMKIALDRVGIKDSPREFKNQEFFKPFCCKIFEVDPTGVIACVERVNPISSMEEFLSIADDVFNMMVTKIIGKYVVDDLGTEKFMNYGIRYNSNGVAFGPVVLDYPYAYELDGAKLHCSKPVQIGDKEFVCGGEIDYDAGLNNLVCCKCGRTYSARELAKDDSNVLKFYTGGEHYIMRAKIVRESDNTVIKDSGRSSKTYLTKEEYMEGIKMFELKNLDPRPVVKTIRGKHVPVKQLRDQYYSELQVKAYENVQKKDQVPFNPVIRSEYEPRPAKRAEDLNATTVTNTVVEEEVQDTDVTTVVNTVVDDAVVVNEEVEVQQEAIVDENTVVEEDDSVSTNEEDTDTSKDLDKVLLETVEKVNESYGLNLTIDELKEIMDRHPGDYLAVYAEIEAIKNANKESEAKEEYVEDSDSSFDDNMESEVFPEINNSNIKIGVNLGADEEVDYSNYIPPEEEDDNSNNDEDDDDEYSDLYSVDRKEEKRDNKKNNKSNIGDMSDY